MLTPLTLVLGSEELLVGRAVADVIAAAKAADPECDSRDLSAAGVTAPDLFNLLAPSLFASHRVVVLRGAELATKDLVQALTNYVADPADDVHLVITHAGGVRNKVLVEACRKAGARVVACEALTRAEQRLDFIREEIRHHGGSIASDAAAALLESVGTDLRELASACSQLTVDVAGDITLAEVQRYHRGRAQITGFAIADRAVVGDEVGALEALRWALATGVAHVLIADALADGVRSIAKVASAGRGRPEALAGSLKMPPWKIRRTQGQAQGWTESGMKSALKVVADVNADVKGAAADPSYALEAAIRGIAAARKIC